MTKVLAVIPAYNEGDIIKKTIEGLFAIDDISQVVVVNDGSTDKTSLEVRKTGAELIELHKNMGKGYALKEVFDSYDYDYICLVDGDLGVTSIEMKKLIDPVVRGEVDFTVAKFPSPEKKGGFGLVKNLARRSVKFHSGVHMDNSLSGQRVYRREVIDSIKYIPNNYGIEVAMTSQALKKGYTFKNIPVKMTHRFSDRSLKGFKHRGKQFWEILKTSIALLVRGR